MTARGKRAFNLIELLVIIGILGILLAILLPAMAINKAKGQQAQCANNLRQIGIGLSQFVAQNSVYPLFVNPQFRQGLYPEHTGGWWGAIRETGLGDYSVRRWGDKDTGLFHCPAARPPPVQPPEHYSEYGYNAFGLSSWGNPDSLGLGGHRVPVLRPGPFPTVAPPVSASEVAWPSDMMAVGDGFQGEGRVLRDGTMEFWRVRIPEPDPASTRRAYARHQGKSNVVFCDGHVQPPALRALFDETNDAWLVRWNRDHAPHRDRL
jgi:prepilin-type processing-associated H-X9-DG protein